MDAFGFGVLGGIFASGATKEEEADNKQKSTPRSEGLSDYTPPDISAFPPTSLQKKAKQDAGFADSLIPVKVAQILRNIGDGSQKFALYSQPVGAMCLIGQVRGVESLATAVHFKLADETGEISVNYAEEAFELQQGVNAQVVGQLVLLGTDNFYIEAQHVLLLTADPAEYQALLRYHNVSVARVAYSSDLGAKLKLQNKHSGKISEMPGRKSGLPTFRAVESVVLEDVYDHITEPVDRLVIQYLKLRPDTLAKRSEIVACISELYVVRSGGRHHTPRGGGGGRVHQRPRLSPHLIAGNPDVETLSSRLEHVLSHHRAQLTAAAGGNPPSSLRGEVVDSVERAVPDLLRSLVLVYHNVALRVNFGSQHGPVERDRAELVHGL
ncbi:replication protein A middle subunit, putative [Babesia caballi]|uniref:Replication protein A middle subunit, putative n=1 Tax=Babesia caballi TaxID=5871 RepID=A0AAV4LZE9_BABCB|nr:replication protein A middle subunit, putative [Babesia caballi]